VVEAALQRGADTGRAGLKISGNEGRVEGYLEKVFLR
jgi:hypothetical protein